MNTSASASFSHRPLPLPRPGLRQSGIGPRIGVGRLRALVRAQVMASATASTSTPHEHWAQRPAHLLPPHPANRPAIVVQAPSAWRLILAEATLSFLGLGIPAPAPSWGSMLNDARSHSSIRRTCPLPALAVAGAVLGFNFLGDASATASIPAPGLNWDSNHAALGYKLVCTTQYSCHPEHPDSRGELRRGMNAWRSALCWFCCGS